MSWEGSGQNKGGTVGFHPSRAMNPIHGSTQGLRSKDAKLEDWKPMRLPRSHVQGMSTGIKTGYCFRCAPLGFGMNMWVQLTSILRSGLILGIWGNYPNLCNQVPLLWKEGEFRG